jgi:hypothetical protein
MSVLEMATQYYPVLWSIERLKALVTAKKLTVDEYKAITGDDYGG